MWRLTTSIFGLPYCQTLESLQDCLCEIQRQWRDYGFDAMDWFRIEENYNGEWRQRGFIKMDE